MGGLAALSGAAIAFDLDGTLVDTAPDLVRSLNLIMGEAGLPLLPFDRARSLIGQGPRRMIERGFQTAGVAPAPERLDDLFERFMADYAGHLADESRPYPGAAEALAALKAAGARLAVCTNKPTRLSIALLEALDLARFLHAIVGPDAAAARKPDPRHLETAIEAAGGAPRAAIMVGDSATDAETARAAGASLVLVSFGYTEAPVATLAPDALIDHFDELAPACLRFLGACSG